MLVNFGYIWYKFPALTRQFSLCILCQFYTSQRASMSTYLLTKVCLNLIYLAINIRLFRGKNLLRLYLCWIVKQTIGKRRAKLIRSHLKFSLWHAIYLKLFTKYSTFVSTPHILILRAFLVLTDFLKLAITRINLIIFYPLITYIHLVFEVNLTYFDFIIFILILIDLCRITSYFRIWN